IRSGTLTISASTISADNFGSGVGGELMLNADSQIALSNNANVHAVARGAGSGGSVVILTSPTGTVSALAATVTTGSVGSGNAGPLSVATGQLSLTNGASLKSSALGSGRGGPIAITAASSVMIDGGANSNLSTQMSTGIFSTTSSRASNAGLG